MWHCRSAHLHCPTPSLTLQVNGVATPDLDTFLGVVKDLKDGDFARIKMCHLETTQQKVLTLKMDQKYW